MTSTKTKERSKTIKSKTGKRPKRCSICNVPGHTKRTCTERTDITSTKTGEVIKLCAFPACSNIPDHTSPDGIYCSNACSTFDKKRKAHSTKYKEKFSNETLWEYIKSCEESHRIEFIEVKDSEGNIIKMIPKNTPRLPSQSGYALYLGMVLITLKRWATKFDEFRDAMLMLKQVQETYLLDYGLTGRYNNTITKLILMNNHGMKERKETDHNHMIGVVREVYEKADKLGSADDDPFEGNVIEE